MQTIELRKVYRQAERRFIGLLECIRSGEIDEDVLLELNSRVSVTSGYDQHHITLTARNNIATVINTKALNQLETPAFDYQAQITGHFNPSLFPTDAVLTLKKGAQVMFVKNDPLKKYVNGTLGVVDDLTEESIKVEVENDAGKKTIIEVTRQEWEVLRYSDKRGEDGIKTETVGSFHQYPLKLAWAITVHKSQGKTFDKVIIDLGGGAFEHGQTYVALSRCRTLEGIKLKRPIKYQDILIDDRIMDFYDQIRRY
jgi:hypothetical protein